MLENPDIADESNFKLIKINRMQFPGDLFNLLLIKHKFIFTIKHPSIKIEKSKSCRNIQRIPEKREKQDHS